MAENNKRIAKNALFLYLRMFITMAISLYTVRIVLKVLSVEDYGIYSAVGGIILTFTFISGVLANASQRFFSYELGRGGEGKVREVFSTIYICYLIVSAVFVLLAETIGLWFLQNKMTIPEGREEAAMWVYQFALASFIITITTTPYRAMIIAKEKMNLFAILSVLDAVMKLLIAYMLMLFNTDKLQLYAVLMFVFHTINNGIYYFYCRREYRETHIIWHWDRGMVKSINSYTSWTLFGTLAGMCNTQGVNIVLNMFFGPVANAAYSIASQVYHTVGNFANNFYTAVKPPLIKNYASENYSYVLKLFSFSSKTIYMLLCIVILPIMICTQELLQLWLDQVGDYMVVFVKLSLIYTVILTISYPMTAVVQAGGHVKQYHALVDGFSLIALPVVYVLFKLGFDAHWAYVVSIVVFAIAHFLRIYVMKKVFPLFNVRDYIVDLIIPMVIIFVVGYYSMAYLKSFMPDRVWYMIITCGITALFVLGLCILFLYKQSERMMVYNLLKDKINNKKNK